MRARSRLGPAPSWVSVPMRPTISIWLPSFNIILVLVLAGLVAAGVGILFGLPSLRIKGFYLAVATLAAQFFLSLGVHPRAVGHPLQRQRHVTFTLVLFGVPIDYASRRYLFTLSIVAVLALIAKNLVRGNAGRVGWPSATWTSPAEIIGIRPLRTKLLAFAVSSFYCGTAGALVAFMFLGSVGPAAFDLDRSFQILFMIIIGGLVASSAAFWFRVYHAAANLPESRAYRAQPATAVRDDLAHRVHDLRRADCVLSYR